MRMLLFDPPLSMLIDAGMYVVVCGVNFSWMQGGEVG
jgi:hypothetical protein